MGPWTEHGIPHEQPAWSASAPWLPQEWTLISIYTKEVLRVFFSSSYFFPCSAAASYSGLTWSLQSNKTTRRFSQTKLFILTRPSLPGASQYQGTHVPPHQGRTKCRGQFTILFITKPLSMPVPMIKGSSKISTFSGKVLKSSDGHFSIWVLCSI